jgi:hypothetical protein
MGRSRRRTTVHRAKDLVSNRAVAIDVIADRCDGRGLLRIPPQAHPPARPKGAFEVGLHLLVRGKW